MSSQLSIALTFGLVLVALAPDRAASNIVPPAPTTLKDSAAAQPALAPPAQPPAQPPSIEIVRTKPVPVIEVPPMAGPAAMTLPPAKAPDDKSTAAEADETRGVHLARRLRYRYRQKQAALNQDSGQLGKPGAPQSKGPVTPPPGPKSEPAKAGPPPAPDSWSDAEIITALKECLARLAPLGAEIDIAAAVKHEQCGAPAPVLLKRVGSGANRVELQPPPMLNCAMVAQLHAWIENTVQPAAQEILGTRITRLRNVSGYSCRNRAGSRNHSDRLSEHALANAIDIGTFVTADGRSIELARDWGPTARDSRRREVETAEAKAAVARKEREKAGAELKTEREKLEKDKASLPPPGKTRATRLDRDKAQADLKRRDTELKRREGDLRAEEAAEEQEAERRKTIDRGSLKSTQIQKLGRGADADRRAIPVKGGKDQDLQRPPEARFLRQLHKGACGPFGTVLGPEANDAHRDHFHLDLAPRKRSAFCE